jgi:hypothetical protein
MYEFIENPNRYHSLLPKLKLISSIFEIGYQIDGLIFHLIREEGRAYSYVIINPIQLSDFGITF